MKTLTHALTITIVAAALLAVGCKKDGDHGDHDDHTAAEKQAPAEKPKTVKESTKPAPTAAAPHHLAGYEGVRKALAADDLDAAKAAAGALAARTRKMKHGANYEATAAAADRVAAAADIEAARLAFGDLSKETITMLVAMPAMARGVTTYRCPMARGYQKWIQADAEMANPYMGKKMPKCGSKVDLGL